MMPELKDVRSKVKAALAALLVIDVVAVGLLFSPVVGSANSRKIQMDQLWRELQIKTREVQPLVGLDQKVVTAKQQIDGFYKERLPAQDSAISEGLGKLASANGVHIGQIRYSLKDEDPVGLRPLVIDADLSGNYLQLVRFINALERSELFFIVDSVDLGGEQGGVVKLQIKIETYLKTGV